MKKKHIIQKNHDFENIISGNKRYNNNYFYIYVKNNDKGTYRFGVAVPKKIGKAIVRNKLKRQIRCVLDSRNDYKRNFDYVIIARKKILLLKYSKIKNQLLHLIVHIDKEN